MLSREFLIKQKICCGEGCLMCPYIPKHTKGSTTVKEEPGIDFPCNPEGDCWCKKEEWIFPISGSEGKKCYSPSELKRLKKSVD